MVFSSLPAIIESARVEIFFSAISELIDAYTVHIMEGATKEMTVETVLAEGGVKVTAGREDEKKGKGHDQRDMVRMGKLQETRVCSIVRINL